MNVVIVLFLLGARNRVAVTSSSPVLPTVDLAKVMPSKFISPTKEILRKSFIHLQNERFQRNHYILEVFLKEGISNCCWYDYAAFDVNMDVINSVKNRNNLQEDDGREYGGCMMLHSLSYVNEL